MTLVKLLCFIIGLSIVVVFHEFGHYIFAKIFGVYVYEFSLFMGPKLLQFKKGETKYTIRALPLGGYCSMAGEEDVEAERNEQEKIDVPHERTLLGIKNWKKIIIMAAGGLNNVILAFLVLVIVGYVLGASNPFAWSISTEWSWFTETFKALGRIFTKDGFCNLSSIVGIYRGSSEMFDAGFINYVYFFAAISFSLGFMNLLPFPALDGGRILLTIIESITGKKVKPQVEGIINGIGLLLLLLLVLAITIRELFFDNACPVVTEAAIKLFKNRKFLF